MFAYARICTCMAALKDTQNFCACGFNAVDLSIQTAIVPLTPINIKEQSSLSHPNNSTSNPIARINKFTSPNLRSRISAGKLRLTATVSITLSFTPKTKRCC